MNNLYKLSLIMLSLVLFSMCRKDEIIVEDGNASPAEFKHVSFDILVTDQNYQAIENVVLSLSTHSEMFTSNKYGVIVLNDLTIPDLGIVATFTYQNQRQVKLLRAKSDSRNYLHIIISANSLYSDEVNTGEEKTLSTGGSIKLPSSLIMKNGETYTGPVIVASKYFDPDDPDFLAKAPGNLIAINNNQEVTVLASYGMYFIELMHPDTFEELTIGEGDIAVLKFPIAENQKSTAPNKIPLWTFEKQRALWIEEGEAQLENDMYVAEVSHFSTWNIDKPFDIVDLCIQFVDQESNPIRGLELYFNIEGGGFLNSKATDGYGQICEFFPQGEEIIILLKVENQLLEVGNIGPYFNSTNGIIVTLDLDLNGFANVTGIAKDCQMNPVSDGFIIATNNSNFTHISDVETDGSFSYWAPIEEHILYLVNNEDSKGSTTNLTTSEFTGDIDLGTVELCDENTTKISGYVYKDLDGDGIGEEPLVDGTIKILGDHEIFTVHTNSDGFYFKNLDNTTQSYFIGLNSNDAWTAIASGDFSKDPNDPNDAEMYGPERWLRSNILPFEHDSDNNFLVQQTTYGTVTGKVMIDYDKDGIGDKSAQGIGLFFMDELNNSFDGIPSTSPNQEFLDQTMVSSIDDGTFSMSIASNFSRIWFPQGNMLGPTSSDYDLTPDPDGDDSQLGSNARIPIKAEDSEIDADNNFVFSIEDSWITCRVLLDSDNDGTGDTPIRSLIEIYKRDSNGFPIGNRLDVEETNRDGFTTFYFMTPGEYVLVFAPQTDEYTLIDSYDAITDDNPSNVTGNTEFLPINIVSLEYDDGNTFVVQQ